MRTHYTTPQAAFYRCEESRSRLWWKAHQNELNVHRQALEAFNARHRGLLGPTGFLWDSAVHGHMIVAPIRPEGCRPHTYRVEPPQGGTAWLPDRRTRVGRMLAEQIASLVPFDMQRIQTAAPLPGSMPWIHHDSGASLHFRVVVEGVVHICWPVPIPGLDPKVWTRIGRQEYLDAWAEQAHQERLRGLEVIHTRLVCHPVAHPDLMQNLAAVVAKVLDKHRVDHTRVQSTRDEVLRAERLLVEHHHLGQPTEAFVRDQVEKVLLNLDPSPEQQPLARSARRGRNDQ